MSSSAERFSAETDNGTLIEIERDDGTGEVEVTLTSVDGDVRCMVIYADEARILTVGMVTVIE